MSILSPSVTVRLLHAMLCEPHYIIHGRPRHPPRIKRSTAWSMQHPQSVTGLTTALPCKDLHQAYACLNDAEKLHRHCAHQARLDCVLR